MEGRLYSFFVRLLTFLKATVLEVQTWLHTRVQPSLFSVLIALQCVLYIKGCIYSNLPHAQQVHFCSSTFAHHVPLQLEIHFPSSSLGYACLTVNLTCPDPRTHPWIRRTRCSGNRVTPTLRSLTMCTNFTCLSHSGN